MPVVVVGASTALGRAVVRALRADAVEVRATVPRRVDLAGERLGVPTAVTDFADGRAAGAVLEGAHTVVLLDPDVPWEWLLDAADGSGVRRIVAVLMKGAPPPPADPAYDVVVVRGDVSRADPEVVAAVIEADRRLP
jgi:uncharacterized protein YbjT (DUF2867 family)